MSIILMQHKTGDFLSIVNGTTNRLYKVPRDKWSQCKSRIPKLFTENPVIEKKLVEWADANLVQTIHSDT